MQTWYYEVVSIDGDYANIRDNDAYKPNEWLNLYKILTPTQDLQFTGTTNGIMSYANKYVAGETITIDKNGFLPLCDLHPTVHNAIHENH